MKQGFGPGTDPVIATHLVVVIVGVGVTVFKKPKASSFQVGSG